MTAGYVKQLITCSVMVLTLDSLSVPRSSLLQQPLPTEYGELFLLFPGLRRGGITGLVLNLCQSPKDTSHVILSCHVSVDTILIHVSVLIIYV